MEQRPPLGRLIALDEDVEQREYFLADDIYTIGRLAPWSQIIVNRPTISRVHARVQCVGSHYHLTNLSRLHTYVNGEPISEEYILSDGDQIGLDSPQPVLRYEDENQTVMPTDFEPLGETIPGLHFDQKTMRFFLDGRVLELAPRELRLLRYLYWRRGEACSREECERVIWGEYAAIDPSALHRVVADLRASLRSLDESTEYIETVRSVGYLLK